MPLYEYECQQCHRRTEKRQKFSDPEITECPFCGGHLERVLSAPAFSFSGGGWYKDLYSSAKPAAGKPGEGSGSSEAKAEAKSGGPENKSGDSESKSSPTPAASSPAATASTATASTDKK